MKSHIKIFTVTIVSATVSFLFLNHSTIGHEIALAVFTSALVSIPIQLINYQDNEQRILENLDKDYQNYQNTLNYYTTILFESISFPFRTLYNEGELNEGYDLDIDIQFYVRYIRNHDSFNQDNTIVLINDFYKDITNQISLLEQHIEYLNRSYKAKPQIRRVRSTIDKYKDNKFKEKLMEVVKYSYAHPSIFKVECYYYLLHNFTISIIQFKAIDDKIELYPLYLNDLSEESPFITIYKRSKL